MRLELLHTPGETNDGLSVWLPDTRVLLTGDLFLKAFPNMYAIRGAAPRPVMTWVGSLTNLIALGAEHVVPGHTRPVLGATNARDALTAYRDGIRSVYDQTIEGMKKGERPDELVAHVKLPPQLAGSPYLQEYYGTVEWSVRAIYSDHLGWFDGNATRLFPMPEVERAQKIVALAGGVQQTLSRGREALARGDFRWAAEVADCILAVDSAQRRREAPQGAGPDRTRRAPDERQRQELLPLGCPVPAARPAAVGTFRIDGRDSAAVGFSVRLGHLVAWSSGMDKGGDDAREAIALWRCPEARLSQVADLAWWRAGGHV